MKVKIGFKYYDSEDQPIMIVLSDKDKENIKNMLKHCTKYAVFAENTFSHEEMIKWMD